MNTTLAEIWTLNEIAERWKCSPSSVRRQCDLPATDPRKINCFYAGTKRRVSVVELMRIEALGAPATPPPPVKPPRKPLEMPASFAAKMARAKARQGAKSCA